MIAHEIAMKNVDDREGRWWPTWSEIVIRALPIIARRIKLIFCTYLFYAKTIFFVVVWNHITARLTRVSLLLVCIIVCWLRHSSLLITAETIWTKDELEITLSLLNTLWNHFTSVYINSKIIYVYILTKPVDKTFLCYRNN